MAKQKNHGGARAWVISDSISNIEKLRSLTFCAKYYIGLFLYCDANILADARVLCAKTKEKSLDQGVNSLLRA